ncbi:MAG: hypothetical protein JWM80_1988 [Cyanobacteria bacterium RYN_339]|nr:hypothetical protein [Cyanobacteria bacterium RYN_339]
MTCLRSPRSSFPGRDFRPDARDARVSECDQDDVNGVARDVIFIKAAAFQAVYPAFRPKVGVNRDAISCWNN